MKEETKAFRKRKGLSHEALGNLCGVGKSSISNWEKGTNEPHGSARLILDDLMSGRVCIVPLTEQEEKLLDENVAKGGFENREDFLASSLLHLIRHRTFDLPIKSKGSLPLSFVAEEPAVYKTKPNADK